uniref:Uncharacterized protein n=1 Tax=Arundo donax TaxID=35708 RepID=A0A0A8YYL1_ARUDO
MKKNNVKYTIVAAPSKVKYHKEGSASPSLNHINPTLISLAAQAPHPDVSGVALVITRPSDRPRHRTNKKD